KLGALLNVAGASGHGGSLSGSAWPARQGPARRRAFERDSSAAAAAPMPFGAALEPPCCGDSDAAALHSRKCLVHRFVCCSFAFAAAAASIVSYAAWASAREPSAPDVPAELDADADWDSDEVYEAV